MSELDLGTLRGHVDLDLDKFERKYGEVRTLLRQLAGTNVPDLEVNLDTTDVTRGADRVESAVRGLPDGEVEVTADTGRARDELGRFVSQASDSGAEAGEGAGEGLAGGIIAAIATIPVAGAVVGIGVAIGAALVEGLGNEVREDMFSAQTGLDAATTARFGRAAGEAYANNFGESIEANLDAARVAIQAGLLDPNATARDAQSIIESITGVADLLGEDIPRVARTASQAIKTGIANDATGAFDLLVRAQQAGLNVSEDLLDTVDEYGTQFRKLGLEGPQAFGLIAQAVRAGARDTDIGADAIKEFSIRASSDLANATIGYDLLGMSVETMMARVAAGGPDAAAALDETLDGLRAIEDPVLRAQAAVALFGTQAEDMGEALFAMDLSSAVDQFGAVEGAAQSALTTMGDNAAGQIETAKRNIETAADGIQGALAQAFGPQIEGFSSFVTENREAVMQFLLDAANGAFDFARAIVNGAADMTESTGEFIAGPAADMIQTLGDIALAVDKAFPGDQGGKATQKSFEDIADGMRTADEQADELADTIRRNLVEQGIDPMQAKLDSVAIPMVAQAALHDTSLALAGDLAGVGYAADGSKVSLEGLNGSVDLTTAGGRVLDQQLRAVADGLDEQARAGNVAGDSQEALTARYQEGRDELVRQLEAMGYTAEQAQVLADKYGAIPGKVETIIAANTDPAQRAVDDYVNRNNNRRLTVIVDSKGGTVEVGGAPGTMRGFAGGGFTGPGGKHEPKGVVHAEEFVFDQETTARNRPLFEAIHAGVDPAVAFGATASQGAAAVSLQGMTVVVQVGEREFTGYVADVADGRVRQGLLTAASGRGR